MGQGCGRSLACSQLRQSKPAGPLEVRPVLDRPELAAPGEPDRLAERAAPRPQRVGASLMRGRVAPAGQRQQLGRHDIEREPEVVEAVAGRRVGHDLARRGAALCVERRLRLHRAERERDRERTPAVLACASSCSAIARTRGWRSVRRAISPPSTVRGDSMATPLMDGDEVLVDQSDAAQGLRDGIYVLRREDTLMVKCIALGPVARRLDILSDNPAYPSWRDCPADGVDVLARVVWFSRELR